MIAAARLLAFTAACSFLVSCENGQNPFARFGNKSSSSNDPYVANYGNDGGYNPYPGQSGYAQGGSSTPSYSTPSTPTYSQPPAPAEADPYAFNTSSSSSGSSSSYSPPKSKPSSSTKKKSSGSSTKKSSSRSYTVARGDTLYSIARKRGTTVAKLKSTNGLRSDVIRPGQSLKIP